MFGHTWREREQISDTLSRDWRPTAQVLSFVVVKSADLTK